MKTIGDQIRNGREKKDLTREQLAKRLDITPAYLGHLENDSHVRLSERVQERLEKVLGIRLNSKMVLRHNDKSARWYRDYRAAQKPASKKPKQRRTASRKAA